MARERQCVSIADSFFLTGPIHFFYLGWETSGDYDRMKRKKIEGENDKRERGREIETEEKLKGEREGGRERQRHEGKEIS